MVVREAAWQRAVVARKAAEEAAAPRQDPEVVAAWAAFWRWFNPEGIAIPKEGVVSDLAVRFIVQWALTDLPGLWHPGHRRWFPDGRLATQTARYEWVTYEHGLEFRNDLMWPTDWHHQIAVQLDEATGDRLRALLLTHLEPPDELRWVAWHLVVALYDGQLEGIDFLRAVADLNDSAGPEVLWPYSQTLGMKWRRVKPENLGRCILNVGASNAV